MSKFLSLVVIFLFSFSFVTPIFAQDNLDQGEVVTLAKDQIINKDYFAAGDHIVVSGTVNGDAYIAGGSVLVDGMINGDLLVAGGNVTLNGPVTGNIRAAGGNITVSSSVGRNMTLAGGNVNVTNVATISGSLVAGAGTLDIFAPITKGITVGAGQLTIGNSVGDDVVAGVGNMNMTSGARINGNVIYWSDELARIQPEASVAGQVTHNRHEKEVVQEVDTEGVSEVFATIGLVFHIISFVSALSLGLLLIALVPNLMQKFAAHTSSQFWLNMAVGFGVVFLTPILAILLMITVVGLPLGVLLFVMYFVLLYFAKIIIALTLGNWISKKLGGKMNLYLSYLVGLFVLYLLFMIPFLGGIISFVTLLIGVGSLVLVKKEVVEILHNSKTL